MGVKSADFEQILRDLTAGKSLKLALEHLKIEPYAFFQYLSTDNARITRYSLARENKADMLAEEIIDIADTDPDPNSARIRVETRRWYASKLRPKVYGDKIDVNINQTVDISAALSDAQKRREKLISEIPPKRIERPSKTDVPRLTHHINQGLAISDNLHYQSQSDNDQDIEADENSDPLEESDTDIFK